MKIEKSYFKIRKKKRILYGNSYDKYVIVRLEDGETKDDIYEYFDLLFAPYHSATHIYMSYMITVPKDLGNGRFSLTIMAREGN